MNLHLVRCHGYELLLQPVGQLGALRPEADTSSREQSKRGASKSVAAWDLTQC